MKRIYETILNDHLKRHRQMALMTGPRQVGKTTTSLASAKPAHYFNWDRQSDRIALTRGADAVADTAGIHQIASGKKHIIFDELHKYRKWKSFLKGFFDVYGRQCGIVLTGSSRMDVYRRGGDSLMGRYFIYRMHPLSIGELISTKLRKKEIRKPERVKESNMERLLTFGGFPEPYLKATTRFHNRWKRLRLEQLFREDLRDLTQIHEVGQMQVLATLISNQVGQLVNYSSMSNDVNVSVDTIRRWIATLESFFFCFTIRPWFRNIPKSLRKQPKVYLWDWSMIDDPGARRENFVASHLLKAVHAWTDLGFGDYGLYYLRDKTQREVDFLVTRDGAPWFMVEAKSSDKRSLSDSLSYFKEKTRADHAFQVAFDTNFVAANCFSQHEPVRVPASTFLSQLV